MTKFPALLSLAMFALAGIDAAAQPAFDMRPVPTAPGTRGQVLNAEPADRAAWPLTFVFRADGGGCTATGIGPRTILTAAHCVADGATGRITFQGQIRDITCSHHPEYRDDTQADYALCLANDGLALATGQRFEHLATSLGELTNGMKLLLLGYGCTLTETLANGQRVRDFGVLYQGETTIARIPNEAFTGSFGRNLYIRTEGGAAVCYGDSGGSSYAMADTAVPAGRRRVVGIASRGDISRSSWLSSVAATTFVDWAKDWAVAADNALICGLTTTRADLCRP